MHDRSSRLYTQSIRSKSFFVCSVLSINSDLKYSLHYSVIYLVMSSDIQTLEIVNRKFIYLSLVDESPRENIFVNKK